MPLRGRQIAPLLGVALFLGGCSAAAPDAPPVPAWEAATSTSATSVPDPTATGQRPFPLGPKVPPSIGDSIIGGNMCDGRYAYWTSEGGHPVVQVLWNGVLNVSVSYVDKANNLLGNGTDGSINDGMTGVRLVANDVQSSDVAAAELAVAGSALGMCVVPRIGQ